MLGIHSWIHLITVTALAMLFKEYRTLQQILHEEHKVKVWNAGPLPVSPSAYNIPQSPFQDEVEDTVDPEINVTEDIQTHGSSVWCRGTNHTDRLCRFKNACYIPDSDSFVFFHHKNSAVSGVPANRFSPTLLDWSSISDHNRYFFNYIDVPASQAKLILEAEYITEPVLTFKRFLPDNLMHVFHDDLLPAFVTLRRISAESRAPFKVKLLFMDKYDKGPYWFLYQTLVKTEPMRKEQVAGGKPTCFRELHVGVSKETVWYDYGFKEHQRPIPNATVNALTIRQFTNHIKTALNVQDKQRVLNQKRKLAVLLVRKENRLILNQNALIEELTSIQFKVAAISLEDMSLQYAIEQVSQASLVLGMHGSLMTLTMFAAPKTLIIECFPYAIWARNYTPFKIMVNIPGMDLVYKTWENTNDANSLTHPERPWQQGGIRHLPEDLQFQIRVMAGVPKHTCCNDPHFLYRIYQDTAIDTVQIRTMVLKHFNESSLPKSESQVTEYEKLFKWQMPPGVVRHLNCRVLPGKMYPVLQIMWDVPWNMQYLEHSYILYEALLQEAKSSLVYRWSLRTRFHELFEGIEPGKRYYVWVRALLDDYLPGPFNTEEVVCIT